MPLRPVTQLIRPPAARAGHLTFYQPLPAAGLDYLDPFLLLHHHGPHQFAPSNAGLPFGPHPHRGFETVTFIYDGDVLHRDSTGYESTIRAGGVQWMTAGAGLVHSENLSPDLRQHGGRFEIIQLWINLPARLKMHPPAYQGFQRTDIPAVTLDNGNVVIDVVAGAWDETNRGPAWRGPAWRGPAWRGPAHSLTDVQAFTLTLRTGGQIAFSVPESRTILLYQLHGETSVNNVVATDRALVAFTNEHTDGEATTPAGQDVVIQARTDSRLLLCTAEPLREPVVSHGPFVMNTEAEIRQAMRDYGAGRMGVLAD